MTIEDNGKRRMICIVFPKDRLANAMAVLAAVRLKAPVSLGDVIIRDLLATGADVVATRNMDKL